MPITTGKIRTDNEDAPYLDKRPADGILHAAYQEYEIDDIGGDYSKIYSTDERHMVNGINSIYGTSYNWGDLRGKEVEFFVPDGLHPVVRLKFSKVGIYFVAEVVLDASLDLDDVKALVKLDDMSSREAFPSKDVLYYSSKDNQNPLRQFVRANFSTDKLSFNPSRDVDFTLMHLGDDAYLTPVMIRNYSNHGGYTTLLFKNEVLPAIELKMKQFSKDAVLRLLGTETGVALTNDNYIANDVVRVFDPVKDIDDVYTIYTLQKGDETRYFAAQSITILAPTPLPPLG